MSLASILRSRFSSTVTSTFTSWSSRLSAQRPAVMAVGGSYNGQTSSMSPPQLIHQNQTRSRWVEVIRQVPSEDPNKVGEMEFEDRDLADLRVLRAMRAETPLRKRPNFARHEKKWMRRKRLKMERRYLKLQQGVEELKAYIQFKQDNKPDW